MSQISSEPILTATKNGLRVAMLLANSCRNDSRVIKEAESLAAAGHDVTVFCLQETDLPNQVRRNGVCYIRLRHHCLTASLARLGEALKALPCQRVGLLTKALRRLGGGLWFVDYYARYNYVKIARIMWPALRRHQPQVIHAHDLITLPAAVRAARRLGVKVVYDAHELEQHRNRRLMKLPVIALLFRMLVKTVERYYAHRANAHITVSESCAEFMARDLGIEKPVLIYNAPRRIKMVPVKRNLREDCGLPETTPLAVYVGGILPNRGLEFLVRSLVYAPDFHLAMVGPCQGDVDEIVLNLARQAGVAERLHLLVPVPYDQVVPYIASADLGVYAIQNSCLSYDFSMPNKLFEMSFAGLPIVVSNLTEVSRFVAQFGHGLTFDQNDPQAAALAMRRVHAEHARFRPSAKTIDDVAATYAWEAQEIKLKALYARLMIAMM